MHITSSWIGWVTYVDWGPGFASMCSYNLHHIPLFTTTLETLPGLLSACSQLSRFDPDFEKHLGRSNVPSCSWDVQQKKQQTGAHWTVIDTQLEVALMSRKAVFSFFLFTFKCSWSVQVTDHWQCWGNLNFHLKYTLYAFNKRAVVCASGGSITGRLQVWSLQCLFYLSLSNETRSRADLRPLTPPVQLLFKVLSVFHMANDETPPQQLFVQDIKTLHKSINY